MRNDMISWGPYIFLLISDDCQNMFVSLQKRCFCYESNFLHIHSATWTEKERTCKVSRQDNMLFSVFVMTAEKFQHNLGSKFWVGTRSFYTACLSPNVPPTNHIIRANYQKNEVGKYRYIHVHQRVLWLPPVHFHPVGETKAHAGRKCNEMLPHCNSSCYSGEQHNVQPLLVCVDS